MSSNHSTTAFILIVLAIAGLVFLLSGFLIFTPTATPNPGTTTGITTRPPMTMTMAPTTTTTGSPSTTTTQGSVNLGGVAAAANAGIRGCNPNVKLSWNGSKQWNVDNPANQDDGCMGCLPGFVFDSASQMCIPNNAGIRGCNGYQVLKYDAAHHYNIDNDGPCLGCLQGYAYNDTVKTCLIPVAPVVPTTETCDTIAARVNAGTPPNTGDQGNWTVWGCDQYYPSLHNQMAPGTGTNPGGVGGGGGGGGGGSGTCPSGQAYQSTWAGCESPATAPSWCCQPTG